MSWPSRVATTGLSPAGGGRCGGCGRVAALAPQRDEEERRNRCAREHRPIDHGCEASEVGEAQSSLVASGLPGENPGMGRSLCVGLGGGSGAGKSALAQELALALGPERVLLLACDAYYRDRPELDPAARAAQNFDHPDALETELLAAQLDHLRAGRAVDVPSYDFASTAGAARPSEPSRARWSWSTGCSCSATRRCARASTCACSWRRRSGCGCERRLARDVAERGRSAESVRAQLAATVQPMHAAFVEPSRAHADLVLANDRGAPARGRAARRARARTARATSGGLGTRAAPRWCASGSSCWFQCPAPSISTLPRRSLQNDRQHLHRRALARRRSGPVTTRVAQAADEERRHA